jgi:isopenicillin N synthase-like dioxygenase
MNDLIAAGRISLSDLPVINIAGCYSDDRRQREAVATEIRAACMDKGFFYISGHGVPTELTEGIKSQAREFFSLSEEAKRSLDKSKSPANRGYEPLGGQTLEAGARPDQKESFYVGLDLGADHPRVVAKRFNHGANVWPKDMPKFRSVVESYFAVMGDVANTIIRSIALALELDESYFDEFCREPLATLRLLHYPPQALDADSGTHGAGAHTDFGSVTILFQDSSGGLEVFDRESNTWIHAQPIPGTFVVNLGDLVERWSNGRFASTRHRVNNTSGGDRYSVAFFYSGNPDYAITCLPGCLSPGASPIYPPTTVEGHLRECYERTYGSK